MYTVDPLAKSPPDLLSAASSADLSSSKTFQTIRNQYLFIYYDWQTHVDVITSIAATRLYPLKIEKNWFKPTTSPLICHPPSVGVLFSGLASQSFQDSMRKSGSYTTSSHVYYLSCYSWRAK